MLNKSIKDFNQEDRPREKLISKGADSLSDEELLAIIIGTGTKEKMLLNCLEKFWKLFLMRACLIYK